MEKVGEDLEDSEKNHSSDDDIYIMMKCVSVCLSVTKNNHFLERHQDDV